MTRYSEARLAKDLKNFKELDVENFFPYKLSCE
jgi:hypothetical protein